MVMEYMSTDVDLNIFFGERERERDVMCHEQESTISPISALYSLHYRMVKRSSRIVLLVVVTCKLMRDKDPEVAPY